mmetsp:Transcript_62378/g.203545  ORF Transcript_62378/g.203545 Transcript_62378/m.203545 type:complete len:825 (-) Transcript_62378:597-3071(-)
MARPLRAFFSILFTFLLSLASGPSLASASISGSKVAVATQSFRDVRVEGAQPASEAHPLQVDSDVKLGAVKPENSRVVGPDAASRTSVGSVPLDFALLQAQSGVIKAEAELDNTTHSSKEALAATAGGFKNGIDAGATNDKLGDVFPRAFAKAGPPQPEQHQQQQRHQQQQQQQQQLQHATGSTSPSSILTPKGARAGAIAEIAAEVAAASTMQQRSTSKSLGGDTVEDVLVEQIPHGRMSSGKQVTLDHSHFAQSHHAQAGSDVLSAPLASPGHRSTGEVSVESKTLNELAEALLDSWRENTSVVHEPPDAPLMNSKHESSGVVHVSGQALPNSQLEAARSVRTSPQVPLIRQPVNAGVVHAPAQSSVMSQPQNLGVVQEPPNESFTSQLRNTGAVHVSSSEEVSKTQVDIAAQMPTKSFSGMPQPDAAGDVAAGAAQHSTAAGVQAFADSAQQAEQHRTKNEVSQTPPRSAAHARETPALKAAALFGPQLSSSRVRTAAAVAAPRATAGAGVTADVGGLAWLIGTRNRFAFCLLVVVATVSIFGNACFAAGMCLSSALWRRNKLGAMRRQVENLPVCRTSEIEQRLPASGGYDCMFSKPLSSKMLLRLEAYVQRPTGGSQLTAPLTKKTCVLYSSAVSRQLHDGMSPVPVAFSFASVNFTVALVDSPKTLIQVKGTDVSLFDMRQGRHVERRSFNSVPDDWQDFISSHRTSPHLSATLRSDGATLEFQECTLCVGALVTLVGELHRDANGVLSMRPWLGKSDEGSAGQPGLLRERAHGPQPREAAGSPRLAGGDSLERVGALLGRIGVVSLLLLLPTMPPTT